MPKPTAEEMFEKLWTQYPADLCKGKRGGRQPAFRAFKKINPDEKEFERIMANMKAMIKADRGDKDAYRWPFVSSYLNQARYDDFIMPKNEASTQTLGKCSRPSCNDNVHGSGFTECSLHMPSVNDVRYRKLVEAKKIVDKELDRNAPNFANRCMQYAADQGFIFPGAKKKEKARWQPMDTAPKDGTTVDLWDIGGFKVESARWDTEINSWSTLNDDSRYGYWMERA